MKRVFATLMVVLVTLTLFACAPAVPAAPTTEEASAAAEAPAVEAPAAAEKIVVAGLVFQEDQFMKMLAEGYKAAAKDAGVECLTANTGNDATKEAELINTYIAQNVAGIAICSITGDPVVPLLQAANEAGVKIALAGVPIPNTEFNVGGYASDDYAFCAQTGALAAEYIKANLNGEAKIGILQFKSQGPTQSKARVDGFFSELDKAGIKYTIVADQDAWLQDMAVEAIGDMMTANPDINVVFAANEGGTIGATLGLTNAGYAGKVVVFGTDASEQIIDLLKDDSNILQVVTGQDPYSIGYNAMQVLINAIKGGDVSSTQNKMIVVPGSTLRRDDVAGLDAFLENLKVRMGG